MHSKFSYTLYDIYTVHRITLQDTKLIHYELHIVVFLLIILVGYTKYFW